MDAQEALETIRYEVDEECHCGYIENELRIAMTALKKQIPKKLPIVEELYHCPVCGEKDAISQGDNYCFNCGQALDWSDTE